MKKEDLKGLENKLWEAADKMRGAVPNDLHKDLKADYVLTNPSCNLSDWGQEKLVDDSRWKYGIPPKGNANFGFEEKIKILTSELAKQFEKSHELEDEIRKNLEAIRYGC